MTYRDFSNRQLEKFKRDCHKAMLDYQKRNPQVLSLDPVAWQAAWSKAFISGVNQLEAKYKNLGLFDIPTNENVKPVEGTATSGSFPRPLRAGHPQR